MNRKRRKKKKKENEIDPQQEMRHIRDLILIGASLFISVFYINHSRTLLTEDRARGRSLISGTSFEDEEGRGIPRQLIDIDVSV